MYAYCGNNPIIYNDRSGAIRTWSIECTDGAQHNDQKDTKDKSVSSDNLLLMELNSHAGMGVVEPNGAINCRINIVKGTYEVTDSYIRKSRAEEYLGRILITMGLTKLTGVGGFAEDVYDIISIDNKAFTLIPGTYIAYYVTMKYEKEEGIPSSMFHFTENRIYIIISFATGDTASYF